MNAPNASWAARPLLGRSHHAVLFLLFLAFAVYGSLVPFRYRPMPFDTAVNKFRTESLASFWGGARSDWLANCLLDVPLGYFLTGVFCVDLRRAWRWLALLAILLCGTLSTMIEFSQLYFPPRVSSGQDVAAQVVGAIHGALLWVVCGQTVANWARGVWANRGQPGWALRLLPAYLVALAAIHVLPIDLTLSPVEVYRKYRSGMIRLGLFEGWGHDGVWEEARRQLWQVLYFAPLGVLAAYFRAPAWSQWSGWRRVGVLGLVVAGGIEAMQLIAVGRFVNTTDVLTGALAVLAGWAATLAVGRPAPRGTQTGTQDAPSTGSALAARVVLGALWVVVAVFITWRPFDFRWDMDWAAERLEKLSLIPFADYHADKVFNALDQAIHKILLYVPLGAVLAPLGWKGRMRAMAFTVLAAATAAAVLEAGQLFLPSRYPSVTDVLVESFGGWLGFVLCWRFFAANPSGEQVQGEVAVVYRR